MLSIAFLTGFFITRKGMTERGIDPELAPTLLIYTMLGGVVGSKIYFTIDVGLRTGAPFSELFLSRAGITWYGGLIGGTLAGMLACQLHKLSKLAISACIAPALAVGQALGRVGCFLVGDDYGKVTDVAWGVAFPNGSPPTFDPVHPTQLYEIAWLLPVAGFLWARRRTSPFVFGEYMALNGLGRIVIEHWRVNPQVALGMTEPQWIGVLLMVGGMGGWIYQWKRLRGVTSRPGS
jgi:phosphatidylglycerol:prolipoprotein diacylglycerol transferase